MIDQIKQELDFVKKHLSESSAPIYEFILYKEFYERVKEILVPPILSEDECVPSVAIISEFKHLPPSRTCPNCGSMRYRIVYTDDEMTEVKFYDCLMCRHSWC